MGRRVTVEFPESEVATRQPGLSSLPLAHVFTAIEPDELRRVDPNLRSLENVNTPADYDSALRSPG
jgi:hypothetical protein